MVGGRNRTKKVEGKEEGKGKARVADFGDRDYLDSSEIKKGCLGSDVFSNPRVRADHLPERLEMKICSPFCTTF